MQFIGKQSSLRFHNKCIPKELTNRAKSYDGLTEPREMSKSQGQVAHEEE